MVKYFHHLFDFGQMSHLISRPCSKCNAAATRQSIFLLLLGCTACNFIVNIWLYIIHRWYPILLGSLSRSQSNMISDHLQVQNVQYIMLIHQILPRVLLYDCYKPNGCDLHSHFDRDLWKKSSLVDTSTSFNNMYTSRIPPL